MPYHHGNLRSALLDASFTLLAEHGLSEFSVAKVARAVGVSTASPYRHFADRDALLDAVAAQAAVELADRIRADVEAAGEDPVERFAVTAGTYVRFVVERGAGLDVIFRADAGRDLMDLLLDLAGQVPGEDSLTLLERHLVAAHGYVTLYRSGFFKVGDPTVETIAERAVEATRSLLDGA
ncbi:MAG TPA: TetR/AcrR family transcriptional regulator [Solirubrobacter sp.]